jgi:hypothetical protein
VDELESRAGIDAAPNQPAARHAIDVDPLAGDPGAAAVLLWVLLRCRCL